MDQQSRGRNLPASRRDHQRIGPLAAKNAKQLPQRLVRLVCSGISAKQEKSTAAGAVSSDYESLLDVGSFGWARDKETETGALETDSVVGLVHVVNNLAGWNDQHKVLGDDEDRPVRT